jgi:AcrR family transcriptional regulator
MDTKKKIYRTAAKMFLEKGYDNTPMSHIARELGLSKAGLYHHYPSKENLLFDVIDDLNEKSFIPVYEEAVKISDPEKRLIFFLRRFTELMTIDASSRIAVHEVKKLKPHHFKKVTKSWRMTYDLIKDAISEMQASGKAKKINSAFAAFAAIGMCSWTYYWFDYSKKESGEELPETFVEIFLRGITKGNE